MVHKNYAIGQNEVPQILSMFGEGDAELCSNNKPLWTKTVPDQFATFLVR